MKYLIDYLKDDMAYFITEEALGNVLEILDELHLQHDVYCIIHNSEKIIVIISESDLLTNRLLQDEKYKQVNLSNAEKLTIQNSLPFFIGNPKLL